MGGQAREQLDPRYVKIALGIARSFTRRLPPNVLRPDLEQAALYGLLKAIRRQPNSSGQAFEYYIRAKVRGAILDELRRQDWSPRRGRRSLQVHVVRFDDLTSTVSDDGQPLPRQFATQEDSPEDTAIRNLDAARAWRAPMQPDDARMARDSLMRGRPQKDIAVDEGVSEPRVSQRTQRALVAMRSYLTGNEPDGYITRETRLALARERWR